eukprot:1811814-Pyramimonas_sp.AAC.1
MPPPVKLEHYEKLMKIASAEVRDRLFRARLRRPRTLLQLARVVWRQDAPLARRLQESHPLA